MLLTKFKDREARLSYATQAIELTNTVEAADTTTMYTDHASFAHAVCVHALA